MTAPPPGSIVEAHPGDSRLRPPRSSLTNTVSDTIAVDRPGSARDSDGRGPRVVVGVDGSPGARGALALALVEAARRGAALDVVTTYPVTLVWTGGVRVDIPDTAALRADTDRRARELVDEVRREEEQAGIPGVDAVDVRVLTAEGRPVPVLLEAAEGADLPVLGSRGRGAVRCTVAGSVALHCATHAECPVVVVHPMTAPADGPPRVVAG